MKIGIGATKGDCADGPLEHRFTVYFSGFVVGTERWKQIGRQAFGTSLLKYITRSSSRSRGYLDRRRQFRECEALGLCPCRLSGLKFEENSPSHVIGQGGLLGGVVPQVHMSDKYFW